MVSTSGALPVAETRAKPLGVTNAMVAVVSPADARVDDGIGQRNRTTAGDGNLPKLEGSFADVTFRLGNPLAVRREDGPTSAVRAGNRSGLQLVQIPQHDTQADAREFGKGQARAIARQR